MQSGYLAKYKDINDLARIIYKVLSVTDLTSISQAARKSAFDVHNPQKIASSYLSLYAMLTEKINSQDPQDSLDLRKTRKVKPGDLLQ